MAPGWIRTPTYGLLIRCSTNIASDDKPISEQVLQQSAKTTPQADLATSLAILVQKHPDLAYLIDRWPSMSDYIKQQILALEHTTTSHEQEGAEA